MQYIIINDNNGAANNDFRKTHKTFIIKTKTMSSLLISSIYYVSYFGVTLIQHHKTTTLLSFMFIGFSRNHYNNNLIKYSKQTLIRVF